MCVGGVRRGCVVGLHVGVCVCVGGGRSAWGVFGASWAGTLYVHVYVHAYM